MKNVKIFLKDGAVLPCKATEGSSGYDLIALENYLVLVGRTTYISTGIFLEMPEGLEAQIRPRSGLSTKQGLIIPNSPGTIDCFANDSVILTQEGNKTIDQIRINEIVYSFNEETLQIEKDVVTAIVDVGEQEVLTFEFDDSKKITVTLNTLIYTKDGLKYAKDLTVEDEIIFYHDN
jgi:deoxyuridine 5'-triphosphate nucleotidohydrolase